MIGKYRIDFQSRLNFFHEIAFKIKPQILKKLSYGN